MSETTELAQVTAVPRKTTLLPPAWRPQELAADDGGLKRSPHWLLAAIIGFFGVALIWAWLSQIDEIARGVPRAALLFIQQMVEHGMPQVGSNRI